MHRATTAAIWITTLPVLMGLTAIGLSTTAHADAVADADAAASLAAHRLTTAARAVLDDAEVLQEPHARLAEQLLALAIELDPADSHAWRLRLEAGQLVGDDDDQRTLLRRYLQYQTRDDAAQLAWINLLAEQEPNVSDRLALYQRLLDGAGADRLSAALRSRLAYRAAALHREQGRTRDYADRLKQALSLDDANPAAAAEAAAFIEQRGGEDVEVMQALLTLLSADPANSATHERIARRLLACGQHDQAATWFAAVNELWRAEGPAPHGDVLALVSDWTHALWGAGEAETALGLIDSFTELHQITDAADMPVGLQTLRTAILQSRGDEDAAAEAFAALAATLDERYQREDEDGSRLADLLWAHLLFGYELDEVEQMRQTLETRMPMDDPMMRRLRIWHAARKGDAAEARALLEEADDPTPSERLGVYVAELDAETISREERVRTLQDLYEAAPDRLAGLWAADRLRELDARPQSSEDCRRLGRIVQEIPAALREGAAAPGELVQLSVRPVVRRVDYGQPIVLDIELHNSASVPLSLGPRGAVSANVMLVPRATVGDGEAVELAPQFVDMQRRLRLEPGRSLRVRARLDQPDLIALLDEHPLEAVRLSVLATLNPLLIDDGRFMPGVFGSTVQVPHMVRTRVELAERSVDAMIERLSGDDVAKAHFAAVRLIGLAEAAAAEGRDELFQRCVEAVEAQFAELDSPGRAFVLSYVLRHRQRPAADNDAADAEASGIGGAFDRLMERARADESTLVQATLLTANPAGPDPVALELALAREGGVIHQLAQWVEQTRTATEP